VSLETGCFGGVKGRLKIQNTHKKQPEGGKKKGEKDFENKKRLKKLKIPAPCLFL